MFMKEKFSEEYNLILQLNHRKKLICENLFSQFRNSHQSLHDLFYKEYLKSDIYDLIEPSTFKKMTEDYYDEQKIIADTVHDLTYPSTFKDAIEEYYEIQKCIIDNISDFSFNDRLGCSCSSSGYFAIERTMGIYRYLIANSLF